jgi:hypothetical protein
MEKIDRLGWAAGLAFTAYGVRVGIRVSETDVLKRVEIYPLSVRIGSGPCTDLVPGTGKLYEGVPYIPGRRIIASAEPMFPHLLAPMFSVRGERIAPPAPLLSQPSIPSASLRLWAMRRPQPRVGSDSCISFTC